MSITGPSIDLMRRAALVLEHPEEVDWTVQGFGFLRCYLDPDKRFRLNIWDDRLRTRNVSDIHDHPWDFTSFILWGQIANTRYRLIEPGQPAPQGYHDMYMLRIKTGEDGAIITPPSDCRLVVTSQEIYKSAQMYKQRKDEIHRTQAERGTVTLNDRSPPTPDHTARVFWKHGDWVDAKPRPAKPHEISDAIAVARMRAVQCLHQG